MKTDILIVGGGIVGAGILRDLALHGVQATLIEKGSFSSQTSSRSSKMLHGGIRYLETLDFALVWEALHEKNLWLKLCPDLVHEERFHLPIYRDSLRPLWMLKVGLWLYDFLSGFYNTPHKILSRSELLKRFSSLRMNDLQGGGVYSDAIVDDEKLTLKVIEDALRFSSSQAYEKSELISLNLSRPPYTAEIIKNGLQEQVEFNEIVFATGPFTDQLLLKLAPFPWRPVLIPSQGSHLWINSNDLPLEAPVVLTPEDGRVIFVIPHQDKTLVGTTETNPQEDFYNVEPTTQEINYLLENIKIYFPKAKITPDSILGSFAGIRPLVKESETSNRGKTARHHKIYQPHPHAHIIVGGKYTTFRIMARDLVRPLVEKRHHSYNSNRSKSPLGI